MSATYTQIQERVAERLADPVGTRTLKLADDAIREAIEELDAQAWWFNHVPKDDVVLVTGQKEYSLTGVTTPPRRYDFIWFMNPEVTLATKPIPFLPISTFIKAGLFSNPNVGPPNNVTFNEDTQKVRFDRAPTALENGRVVRFAYWKRFDNPVTTVDDIVGSLIVEVATWRIRRYVPGYNWLADLKVADREKMRVKSMVRSTDRFAVGRN